MEFSAATCLDKKNASICRIEQVRGDAIGLLLLAMSFHPSVCTRAGWENFTSILDVGQGDSAL